MENIACDPHVNLDTALALAAAGLLVFPASVSTNAKGEGWDKKPWIGGWQSKATTDPTQIRQWWQTYPNAVPGIELGRSGLVVLDGDRHGGPDGVTALNKTLGGDTLPHPISFTAGGGEHHIFRQPTSGEPLGNGTGSLPKGVDVRGQGGWIVAPGSIRPDGKAWQSDPEAPSLPKAFSSGTIPTIPEHIVGLIRTPPSRMSNIAPPSQSAISQRAVTLVAPPTGRVLLYGKALLDGICSEVASARKGERNKTLNACSYRAGRAVASGALDRIVAEQALLCAAVESGLVAEDGEPAIRATIQSGLNAGLNQPLPPLSDQVRPNVIDSNPSLARPTILHWHDNDNVLVMPKWLVKKMLPDTGVAIVAGQWSSGKTFVALHLAECVASGKLFAGRKVKRQGGTLFMAAEAAGDIPIRLRGINAAPLSGRRERLPFTWVEEVPSISEPMALERMIEIAHEAAMGMKEKFALPLALIVIDTMAAAAGFQDENDAAQAQAVMNVLQALARATGALVVAVDHFGKTTESGTRGSSAKEASADAVLSLIASQTKEGVVEHRTLAIRKLRGGSTGDQIGFSLVPVSFGVDEDGDAITTCVVEFSSDPVATRAPPNDWNKLKDLKQALHVALGENRQKIRPFGSEGPEVEATSLQAVRAEFYKACPAEDDEVQKKDARRKAFGRQLGRAREKGLVTTREIGTEAFIWIATQMVAAEPSRGTPKEVEGFG